MLERALRLRLALLKYQALRVGKQVMLERALRPIFIGTVQKL